MIKGINKQIIEIKCTNNEYFEKVLLFVNNKNHCVPPTYLQKQAEDVTRKIIGQYTAKKRNYVKLLTAVGIISALVLTAVVWMLISVI